MTGNWVSVSLHLRRPERRTKSLKPGEQIARPLTSAMGIMTLHARKMAVREFLSKRDLTGIRQWANAERSPLRTLMSLTFDSEELIRWRAVEAVGPVAADQARLDPDRVREFLRRLFWLMNDESGGISWLSPEMIGEVLRHVPLLIDEYAALLPSFLCEEPFERGTHLAVWRVAGVRPDVLKGSTPELAKSFTDADPAVRAYAATAIMLIDPSQTDQIKLKLIQDDTGFLRYDFESGQMKRFTVTEMISEQGKTGTEAGQVA